MAAALENLQARRFSLKELFSRSSHLHRVIKNLFILLGGRAVGGILFLTATILSARLLEPRHLGLIVMLHAYIMMIRGLVTVKPFEAIVKHGTTAADNSEYDRLGRLLFISLKLDFATALAGTCVAIFGVTIMVRFGYLDPTYEDIGYIYCLLIPFANDGTAVGALRIWDRFNTISYCLVAGAIVRLIGIIFLYLFDLISFFSVALIWLLSSLVQYASLQISGWRTILTTLPKPLPKYRTSFRSCGKENEGIWSFLHVVYWQSSLDLIPKRAGILLTGFLLSPETAAMFRIANDLAGVIAKPALLVRQVIFPDLTRLKRETNKFLALTLRVSTLVTIPATLLAIFSIWFGQSFISITMGTNYQAASSLLTLLVVSATLELAASPLRPFLYVSDSASLSLAIQALGTASYTLIFFLGADALQLLTPGIASIALNGTVVLLSLMFILATHSSKTAAVN